MASFVYSGFKSNRLPRACSRCGRNDHKVVVQHHGRMTVNNKTFRDPIVVVDALEGFCPSCFQDRREALAAAGCTIEVDRRGRKPEWSQERKDFEKVILELIENFPKDNFADAKLLRSHYRQLHLLRQEIIV